MDPHATDVRSLPTSTLNMYLYAIAAWGVGLLGCFLLNQTALAIPLAYLVFLWHAGLTIAWGLNVSKRYRAQELKRAEIDAGVLSVSRILLSSSLLPAIVFLAENPLPDPFPGPGLTAAASIVLVTSVLWGIAHLGVKLSNRYAHVIILVLSSLALPANATGAFSVAVVYGLFDSLIKSIP